MGKAKKKTNLTLEEKLEQALVSESEQPYEVPKNWIWVKLGKTAFIKRGASPRPIKQYVTEDIQGVNWIKIGDTEKKKYITSIKEKITLQGAKKSVFVEEGTLLLSNSMSFGRPYILAVNGCIHDGWLAITAVKKYIEKEYLYYCLLASEWYFESVAVGSAVRNLNSERVSKLPYPLPPLKEQQRIVEQIERLFTKLDRVKELAEEAVAAFEDRKNALLHQAFTGELTAKWRKENDVSLDSWEEKKLEEVCDLKAGKFISTTKISDRNVVNTYPCFGGNGLRGYVSEYNCDGKFSLVGRQGALCGNVHLAEGKFYATEHALVVYPKDKIDNYWLYYLLVSLNLNRYATGVAQPGLSVRNLTEISISKPSLSEQQEVVLILNSLLAKEEEVRRLADVVEQVDVLKKTILAKAFRGELRTNNPSEESAMELLKEVLEADGKE